MITYDGYVCVPMGGAQEPMYNVVSVLNQIMPTIIQLVIIFGILYVVKSILR